MKLGLRRGDMLIWPVVTINLPGVVEVLDEVGFDWLFLDAEHSPLSPGDLQAKYPPQGARGVGVARALGYAIAATPGMVST